MKIVIRYRSFVAHLDRKKALFFILIAAFLSPVFISCDSQKTTQEYLREEKKAIERFITRSGIIETSVYPADSIFQENVYFKTGDGMYFHVVHAGNGSAVEPGDNVMVRFDYCFDIKEFVKGDSAKYAPSYYEFPFSFKYGSAGYFKDGQDNADYVYGCNAWILPLPYVKEGAILNMIIPSSLGSQTNSSAFRPIFYKNLQYTRFRKL